LSDGIRAQHIRHADLELLRGPVTDAGGELRVLTGMDYGLVTSIMTSRVVPGGGPRRHRHPHAEVFVVQEGQGRYEVEDFTFDAEPGDLLIVPPNAWHSFRNTGTATLRLTAIHQNPRAETEFEDGSRRG
jgi:mannose-6-phosphate isomerase-like protein (cupin superfamily)